MQLRGKVVLITGASDGIGAACAAALRTRGALLSLTGRSEDKLKRVSGPADFVVAGDLCLPGFREQLVRETIGRFGKIDILVNNAGVGLYMSAHRAPMDATRSMFELNFFAPLHLTQLAVPAMSGGGGGLIVNVGSIGGKITLPWFTLYSATKYALGSLTDGLRMELRRSGIRTMLVCPGYVQTDFQSRVLAGAPPDLLSRNRRRWAITAEQCAEAIAGGIERDARTVVTPAIGWLLIAFARLFPGLVERQLERAQQEQQAQA